MSVRIDCPASPGPATVVVADSATTGYISARGMATLDGDSKGTLEKVYAKIYSGIQDPMNVPPNHPADATAVDPIDAHNWYFPEIDGASCQTSGDGAPCTLAVWAHFNGFGHDLRQLAYFNGQCGSAVSCSSS
jgi:hypothetical protein